jgi:hypothetical protein
VAGCLQQGRPGGRVCHHFADPGCLRCMVVGCNAPEEISPRKRQGTYGQNQGAHAMPMSFL